jgi:hypothetical protein
VLLTKGRGSTRCRMLFHGPLFGHPRSMIGAALGLIVLGLVLVFFLPWVGIPVGAIGVLLLIMDLVGFGHRAAQGEAGP